jgi:hypothetical protein
LPEQQQEEHEMERGRGRRFLSIPVPGAPSSGPALPGITGLLWIFGTSLA